MANRRILILFLVLVILILGGAVLTQPFLIYRFSTKLFTAYEVDLLKYPNSQLVGTETSATSKVTMATDYTFHSPDDMDLVLEHMEKQLADLVRLRGTRVIREPTFYTGICADETAFRGIFQFLGKGTPCIEVYIYPLPASGTAIQISGTWSSMGFPTWLRGF